MFILVPLVESLRVFMSMGIYTDFQFAVYAHLCDLLARVCLVYFKRECILNNVSMVVDVFYGIMLYHHLGILYSSLFFKLLTSIELTTIWLTLCSLFYVQIYPTSSVYHEQKVLRIYHTYPTRCAMVSIGKEMLLLLLLCQPKEIHVVVWFTLGTCFVTSTLLQMALGALAFRTLFF